MNYLVKNKDNFEAIAGLFILAAICFSESIGLFPCLFLSISSMFLILSGGIKNSDRFCSVSIASVLNMPSLYLLYGNTGRYVIATISLTAFLVYVFRRNYED